MCNKSNNNMSFSSESLVLDLSKDIDELIDGFVDTYGEEILKMVECVCCKETDIDNEYNFKSICNSCNSYLCLKCMKMIEEEELEMEEFLCNQEEEEHNWLCVECGNLCECGCMEYYNEYDIMCLIDTEGDYVYYGKYCVNEKELDIIKKSDWDSGKNCRNFHTRQQFNPNCSKDFVRCVECEETCNYDWEYVGDEEGEDRRDFVEDWENYCEDEDEDWKEENCKLY